MSPCRIRTKPNRKSQQPQPRRLFRTPSTNLLAMILTRHRASAGLLMHEDDGNRVYYCIAIVVFGSVCGAYNLRPCNAEAQPRTSGLPQPGNWEAQFVSLFAVARSTYSYPNNIRPVYCICWNRVGFRNFSGLRNSACATLWSDCATLRIAQLLGPIAQLSGLRNSACATLRMAHLGCWTTTRLR